MKPNICRSLRAWTRLNAERRRRWRLAITGNPYEHILRRPPSHLRMALLRGSWDLDIPDARP